MNATEPVPTMLLSRTAAARSGWDDGRLRSLTARRVLTRVRRGGYAPTAELAALHREHQHLVEVQAAVVAQQVAGVVSHQSAAVLHGLPIWGCALDVACRSAGRRVGGGAARLALDFAEGRCESVGESRSRVLMHRAGLPAPDLQYEVRRADGSLVGRPDFRWGRLLGEFDGRVKYGRLLRPGETPWASSSGEKRREDELREPGWDVVRWGWADLDDPDRLCGRILSAMHRSARARGEVRA